MKQNCVDLISRFYDANLSLAKWDEALGALRDLSDADICFIASHDVATRSCAILHSVGVQQPVGEARRTNNTSAELEAKDDGIRQCIDLFINKENVTNNANGSGIICFENVKTPLGIGDFISIVVRKNKHNILYFLCGRFKSKGPFTDNTKQVLHDIAPYLGRSFNAGHLTTKNYILGQISNTIFDAMPIGIALLDYRGSVISTNKTAKAVIDDGETFMVSNEGLVFERYGHRVRLVDLIASLDADHGESAAAGVVAFSIPRVSGKRPVTITIMKHGHDVFEQDIPIAILYIGDPDRRYHFDSAHLCRLYGLSRAEGRVAALIASGYRLEEISDVLGIAYETVRKHIKQIFSKTGTSRQAELVRVIITGPAVIPS